MWSDSHVDIQFTSSPQHLVLQGGRQCIGRKLLFNISTHPFAIYSKVVAVALRKLQMGAMPDVEGQLSSFLGMPSSCRKSVLAPLDHIKELSLQWVLMPKLDSRGCIQVQRVCSSTGFGSQERFSF